MRKRLEFFIEDESVLKAESILDEIGLDCQTFVKMCFKKLNREKNISFLMHEAKSETKMEPEQQIITPQQNMKENYMIENDKMTKNGITPQMRDYIWETFKANYSPNKKFDRYYCAKVVSARCGITQGSAQIYFHILENLVNGVSNKRTMKFNDLVTYLDYIKEQLPPICIENAVKSLSNSIPYWEERLAGHFADKVSVLLEQYK